MWDYTEKVKDHFINPRNVGEVDNPDGVGEVGSLACGDALKLTFKLDKDKRIEDVKFQTFGCASAIASSSALTEMIKGMTLEEAQKVNNKDIAEFLGGLPDQKMHCSVMGKEALEAAIENYRTGATDIHKLDGKIVCKCFGITEQEIESVVRENDLTTVEEVTNYCKAGGGCGGCFPEIAQIINRVQGEKAKVESKPVVKRPAKLTNIQKMQIIQEVIDEQVRPALKADGGDIDLIDIVGDEVVVAFRGMCANCKLAELTLRDVVQAKLREYVSENITVTEEK
jgi:NifU-like protein